MAMAPAHALDPGAINPGVLLQNQQQQPPQPPPFQPAKPLQHEDASPTAPAAMPTVDPSAQTQPPSALSGVVILGITNQGFDPDKLPREFLQLRERLSRMIGQQKSAAEWLMVAREAQAELRTQGYVTSLVLALPQDQKPRQAGSGAPYELTIVASFLEELEPQGGGDALQAYVRKMLQPLVGGASPKLVFNLRDLERQLVLLRTFGAVDVTATLKRGNRFGGSVLVATIKPTRLTGSVLSDNNVPQPLGSWRLGASLQGYVPSSQPVRVTAIGDNAFSVPSGFVDGFLQASTPLGNQGWLGDVLWGTTSTSSKDFLAGPNSLQTGGTSNYWSVGTSYPVLVRRNALLSAGVKGTFQNSTNDLFFNGEAIQDLSTDRIRAIRFTLDGYTVSPTVINQLSFILSQGFSGFGSGLAPGEQLSNLYGDPNFTSARLSLSRQQNIGRIGNSVTVATLKGSAQASRSALPVPEQFTYGGPLYGRAFNSAYLLGDQGWAASIELGQRFSLGTNRQPTVLMPFAWYDYGLVNARESGLPNQAAGTYGIGARGSLWARTNFELGWGIPSANTLQPNRRGASNSIVYFRLGMNF
jgi:hemolysin activation/secretion protein